MLEKFSRNAAVWLINIGLLVETDIDLYSYAIKNLFLIINPTIIFTIYCIASHKILLGLLEMFSFLLIRKYSGGYHCQSSTRCLILSTIMLIFMAWMSSQLRPSLIIIIILLLCDLELSIKGPVISKNHYVSSKEITHYHKFLLLILCSYNILFFVLWMIGLEHLASCLAIVIIICSISHIICMFGKNKALYY